MTPEPVESPDADQSLHAKLLRAVRSRAEKDARLKRLIEKPALLAALEAVDPAPFVPETVGEDQDNAGNFLSLVRSSTFYYMPPVRRAVPAVPLLLFMLEALELREGQKVLLIGAKSGYVESLILKLIGETGWLCMLENNAAVARHVAGKLFAAGLRRRCWILPHDEPIEGFRAASPWDRILLTYRIDADPPDVLLNQLSEGGIFCGPVIRRGEQEWLVKREMRNGLLGEEKQLMEVAFGPLDEGLPRYTLRIKDNKEHRVSFTLEVDGIKLPERKTQMDPEALSFVKSKIRELRATAGVRGGTKTGSAPDLRANLERLHETGNAIYTNLLDSDLRHKLFGDRAFGPGYLSIPAKIRYLSGRHPDTS